MTRHGPWRWLKQDILKEGFKNSHAFMCRDETDPRFGLWFKHADGRTAVIRHNSLTYFDKDFRHETIVLQDTKNA